MDSGLRELLRDVGCGVLAVVDDRVEFVNEALLSLFRIEDGRWQGAPSRALVDVLVPTLVDGPAFRERCSVEAGGDQALTVDFATVDGRTLECDFQPTGPGDGHRGYLVLIWDVSPDRAEETDRVRRQHAEVVAGRLGTRAQRTRADEAERIGRRLAARNEELAATDAARLELLATASHELRTPLTSILSFSELLADAGGDGGPTGDQVVQYAEIVHRNARRLLDTVEGLLMLAALGSSSRPATPTAVDLGSLIRRTVEDLRPAGAAADVTVTLDVAAAMTVQGDTGELERMLCNVVDNAVKYCEPGGRVDIAASAVRTGSLDAAARIVVTDTGIGIPPDEVAQVFGQFFRASTARKSERAGTGLGLAIAQGVAAHHGGSIALESTLGVGTTLTIELPLDGSAHR